MLQDRTSDLLTENEELRQRLGLDTLDSKEKVKDGRMTVKPRYKSNAGRNESIASSDSFAPCH